MSRRGLGHLEVSSGWIQVLRGSCPKTVQWALAKERNVSDVPQSRGRWRHPQLPKDGRVPRPANPDEAVKAARVRVQRLESALAFGRVRFCRSPCTTEYIKVCSASIGRQFCRCSSEGVGSFHRQVPESFGPPRERACQGTRDVGCRYRTIAKTSRIELRRSSDAVTTSCSSSVRYGDGQMAELEGTSTTQERPRVRQRVSGSGEGGFIPLMPSLIQAELYQWIGDRQTDLQEALVDGNSAPVLELTSKMTEQLREIICSRMVS